jgi:hypothetical protein
MGITFDNNCRMFVDGANPSFIRSLKYQLGENVEYEQEIDYYKKSFHDMYNLEFSIRNMFVVPVHFAKEHKRMLAHAKKILEYNGGSIAINRRFDKLITSLRTAVENREGLLDKEATSYDDIFVDVLTVLSKISIERTTMICSVTDKATFPKRRPAMLSVQHLVLFS